MLFVFLFFLLAIFAVFWRRPAWGLYAVVFLAPFLGLTVDFSRFDWARGLPFLQNLDGPWADFLVLVLFGAAVFKTILRSNPAVKAETPGLLRPPPRKARGGVLAMTLEAAGFFYFLPFFLAGALSLLNVSYEQFGGSLKYLLRPILFFYLMWVFLPVFLIDSEKILVRAIKILFWTAVFAALTGMASLFVSPEIFGFWRRAVPLEFLGLAPFGYNHNILAEVLVSAAPLGFYLFVKSSLRSNPERLRDRHGPIFIGHRDDVKKIYFFGFVLIVVIALLTFARAAWLALGVELLVYYLLIRKGLRFLPSATKGTAREAGGGVPRNGEARIRGLILLILFPLLVYMLLFSLSPIVRSSNATRLDLTGIALTYFKIHPWLGNGVGTFVPLVEQTRLFTVEYGDPLDAHGVLQKLAAEQGLVGLIAFAFFIGWIIRRLYHTQRFAEEKNRLLLICLFMSAAGSFIYQLFNTSYYNQHLWLPVGLALAAAKIFYVPKS